MLMLDSEQCRRPTYDILPLVFAGIANRDFSPLFELLGSNSAKASAEEVALELKQAERRLELQRAVLGRANDVTRPVETPVETPNEEIM